MAGSAIGDIKVVTAKPHVNKGRVKIFSIVIFERNNPLASGTQRFPKAERKAEERTRKLFDGEEKIIIEFFCCYAGQRLQSPREFQQFHSKIPTIIFRTVNMFQILLLN